MNYSVTFDNMTLKDANELISVVGATIDEKDGFYLPEFAELEHYHKIPAHTSAPYNHVIKMVFRS